MNTRLQLQQALDSARGGDNQGDIEATVADLAEFDHKQRLESIRFQVAGIEGTIQRLRRTSIDDDYVKSLQFATNVDGAEARKKIVELADALRRSETRASESAEDLAAIVKRLKEVVGDK